MSFVFIQPTEWWLEISPEIRAESWRRSRDYSTPGKQWSAYLNQLCLNTFLPWFRAEYAETAKSCFTHSEQTSLWEFVNGVAISVDAVNSGRLVLLPSVAEEDILEVQQEWIDIPNWIADYYLAIQVHSDAEWIRVWGYATHRDLKVSHYDVNSRTYWADAAMLTLDTSALWASCQFCSAQETREAGAPLPELSSLQAENWLQQLSNPNILFPRLTIPFSNWAALVANSEWRSQLYQQRIQPTQPAASRSPVHLTQRVQNSLDVGWRSLESALASIFGSTSADPAFNLRSVSQPDASTFDAAQVKLIDVAFQLEQTIALVLGITLATEDRANVRVQIYPTEEMEYLPANLTLSLLSNGEAFQVVQATEQDSYIQLGFRCPVATEFSLQVAIGEWSVQEDFVV